MEKINILATNVKAYVNYCNENKLPQRQTRYISNESQAHGIVGKVVVVYRDVPTKDFEQALKYLLHIPYVTLIDLQSSQKETKTMEYKPNYDPEAIAKVDSSPNISGKSPYDNITIEETAQRGIATADKWHMARSSGQGDTRLVLETLGFIIHEESSLFYTCTPPEGWTKNTRGYWTYINDAQAVQRGMQFYKGAWYDERAELTIQ